MGNETAVSGLEQFKQLVLPLGEAYIHAGLSYHAIRNGSHLRILHARLFLQSRPTGIPQKVVCFQDQEVGYLSLTDLGFGIMEIVERCHRGEQLETPRGVLVFPVEPNTTAQSHFHPLHEIGLPSKRLIVLTLTGAQIPRSRFSMDLDWSLKANNPPYDSLGELLFEFRLGGYNGDFACLEIPVAHIVEVDFRSQVSGQLAEPGVILPPGIDNNFISLGIVVHHQGVALQRLVLFGDQITWSERENASLSADQYGHGEVEIPSGAAIKCFAAYKGIVQHEGWIGDPGSFPNWRRTAYEWADQGCEALHAFLFGENKGRKDARDFEVGVASLLWMLGFGVLQLRTGRLQDNPDLFLTTSGGRMALVECTTDVIDKEGKLAKLHVRARSMKDQLEKSGSGHVELLPVLVTALPKAAVIDIEKATKFGILVVTKEGLQSALERTIIPQDPDVLFQEQVQALLVRQSHLDDGKTQPTF